MKTMRQFLISLLGIGFLAISTQCQQAADTKTHKADTKTTEEVYSQKFTNADFYKDGQLDPDIALQAYLDMLEFYGVPYSNFLKENLWISDFNLGDFENVGMAGIFWINEPDHKYLGHEIYLLPGQMIPEHKHIATDYPAKFESWHVRHGYAYNYSIGNPTTNHPTLPESQLGFISVFHFQKQNVDEIIHLAELESPHFLFAGPEGAIVSEYATYHDGEGLRFTNPNVEFIDILSK